MRMCACVCVCLQKRLLTGFLIRCVRSVQRSVFGCTEPFGACERFVRYSLYGASAAVSCSKMLIVTEEQKRAFVFPSDLLKVHCRSTKCTEHMELYAKEFKARICPLNAISLHVFATIFPFKQNRIT